MCAPQFLRPDERWKAAGAALWCRAALDLRRTRRGAARIPLRGNSGSGSTSEVWAKQARWVQAFVCTEHNYHTKGQAILFKGRQQGNVVILEVRSDTAVRWVVVKVQLNGRNFVLVGYYGPNCDDIEPLRRLFSQLLEFSDPVIMTLGDFNVVLDNELDRDNCKSRGTPKSQQYLRRMMKEFGLCDIWRQRVGNNRDFSFFNKKYRHSSRIDYFLLDLRLREAVKKIVYLPSHLSDHSAVVLDMIFPQRTISNRWTIDRSLPLDQEV
ncbi:hypothetical protein NDU88_005068 [Pleurodeles waltl]|uniref:exodeoxyribonuclease III n=1 Tax=Pleurodeles waltl TaxID=8319 RepID=A0AAV7WA19_PLEWA|nr:hypothetical protein NDU88_005068 [Pleurodeles waltl]